MVEYAYAADYQGNVIRRVTDASDGSVSYSIATAAEDDEGDYWNAPPTPADEWRDLPGLPDFPEELGLG